MALVLAVAAIYGQMWRHEFLVFDDGEYIYRNPHVSSGLSAANFVWALTAYHSNNWHPVTWLSHMIDCQLFGLHAGAHHLMNALLHALNSCIVFLLLRRMTGALWKSALVAAAFAVHPMHVESVAWAAERKDVLSTCFALLTVWAYVSYARRPGAARYVAFAVLFVLGIMAKPMLVTLPFVLLLLDYWPLRRFGQPDGVSAGAVRAALPRLLVEKAPLLVVAVASCVLTIQAQTAGGVVRTLDEISLPMRVANALVSYVMYVVKLIAPVRQAFTYPYPKQLPVLGALVATVVLAAITALVVHHRRARPAALVGWLWFLGTLVPVIGVVQVGMQAMADRYAYFPSIGLFMLVAWGLDDLSLRWPRRETVVGLVSGIALVVFGCEAWVQTRYWKDSITFFTRDVSIVKDDPLAYRHLGVAFFEQRRYGEAVGAFRNVLRLHPNDEATMFNLALSFERQGLLADAAQSYQQAIRLKPDHTEAHYNLADLLERMGRGDEAIAQFREAIRLQPARAEYYTALGNALGAQGREDEAIANLEEAIRRSPSNASAHNNLGGVLVRVGRAREAFAEFARALELDPRLAEAEANRGLLYLQMGDSTEGRKHLAEAVRLKPELAATLGAQPPASP